MDGDENKPIRYILFSSRITPDRERLIREFIQKHCVYGIYGKKKPVSDLPGHYRATFFGHVKLKKARRLDNMCNFPCDAVHGCRYDAPTSVEYIRSKCENVWENGDLPEQEHTT